jgi:hypothetical protein
MRRQRFLAIFCLMVLAAGAALYALLRLELVPARYNLLLPLDLAEAPGPLTGIRLWLIAGDTPACVTALRRASNEVRQMPERSEQGDCARAGTVMVSKLSAAGIKPEEMRCDIALRLYLLERHIVQPLARRHLGSEVARISHFGSYSCRAMRGSSRLSEHATANAFDISGFELANGRNISLKRDWTAGGAPARFLREVRRGACRLFNMVLSPDYNADHADHFHVDMGLFRGCH